MTQRSGGEPDVAAVASLFADRRRARMLMALAAGRELSAGELAHEAGVSASTASSHLAMLRAHGLVTVSEQGRHRFYRLATADVERILEALAAIAPLHPISSLREHSATHALREGRTCSGHLAGRVGVRVFRDMVEQGWIVGAGERDDPELTGRPAARADADPRYRLTELGAGSLFGGELPTDLLAGGAELTCCLDRTEQAPHLAGSLGQADADRLLESGVVVRGPAPRSVTLQLPPGTPLVDMLRAPR